MTSTAEWLAGMDEFLAVGADGRPAPGRLAELVATSTAAPYSVPPREPKEVKVKPPRVLRPLVIHIAPELGEVVSPKVLCSTKRGRAAKDPSAVCLTIDRWCSRCWNKWAKSRAL